MGLFDSIKKQVKQAASMVTNPSETFTFDSLPKNVAELSALPEAKLESPYQTAALAVAALCSFSENEAAVHEMLDFLKGPDSLSGMEKQFLRDRMAGKDYKALSFFAGAVPDNGYKPEIPYRITVTSNPYSFTEENWGTVYVKSGGADSPRPIKLRRKPSTGQWFLVELQCLADIRVPKEQDPWA